MDSNKWNELSKSEPEGIRDLIKIVQGLINQENSNKTSRVTAMLMFQGFCIASSSLLYVSMINAAVTRSAFFSMLIVWAALGVLGAIDSFRGIRIACKTIDDKVASFRSWTVGLDPSLIIGKYDEKAWKRLLTPWLIMPWLIVIFWIVFAGLAIRFYSVAPTDDAQKSVAQTDRANASAVSKDNSVGAHPSESSKSEYLTFKDNKNSRVFVDILHITLFSTQHCCSCSRGAPGGNQVKRSRTDTPSSH
jgi:hypothetical protein